jgi:hypothetical protein
MTDGIKPTTITGIKRLAKGISRERNVSHSTALDRAAVTAGFSNYTHAKRSLDIATTVKAIAEAKFTTYISIPVVDKETGKAKTCILEVSLPRPIDDFLEAKDFRGKGIFRAFSRKAADHISYRPNFGLGDIQTALCETARQLQFIATTGLKRCQSWDVAGSIHSLPAKDHSSTWFDPATKKGLFIDEPYGHHRDVERQQWADTNGYEMAVFQQWGLYKPGSCTMYAFSRLSDGVPLGPIVAALEKADRPVTKHNWNIHVVDGRRFTSPQQIADKAAAKAA